MNTKRLYFLNRLLCSPLEAMFTLLIFVMGKEVGATPFQLAVVAASKPLVSVLAFYLSALIVDRPQKIKGYLITLCCLGLVPCVGFPYMQDPWFFAGSFALFSMTTRASFPAWAEILKRNLGIEKMSSCISKGTSINYAILLSLPLLFSFLMDHYSSSWRWVYLFLAAVQTANIFVILTLTIPQISAETVRKSRFNVLAPLNVGWRVLRETPSFAHYLLMFMLGGAGIVATQSILPIYFKEVLNISYTQLTLAFSFCKGVAFVMTSARWAHYANRVSIFFLNGVMNLLTCLFFLCLFISSIDVEWLYVGYLFYGVMQAGSELSWNLSGPLFSQQKESTRYSSLNLIMVGVRGSICPFMGQFLFAYSGFYAVFSFAFILCIVSVFYAFRLNYQYRPQLPMPVPMP